MQVDPSTAAAHVTHEDREFFIAYAQTQRRKISESALRTYVTGDGHAPEDYRADTVRNLDGWYAAFDVRPAQRLYLEPWARVRGCTAMAPIWPSCFQTCVQLVPSHR